MSGCERPLFELPVLTAPMAAAFRVSNTNHSQPDMSQILNTHSGLAFGSQEFRP